ncbi:FAD-binding oxidoreductase [Desulfurivibrio alkaliphilus]|uniref:FAD linked oxidase domain protein n=1 Tax=Desulfurivibrio alkaliphilus (strain DSM 19089 / UNIQEM U267 / AHT2) TaxID=589865 RepID=D6Z4H7_DESAT|nr:FAD-binding oxidoreductase [Desulfurivibrio alkaliphilus]ADH86452.1 FAD linked oxidase domain protein [Desulfurivibrio alkaliphilus AHT 2]
MKLSGWGRYLSAESQPLFFRDTASLAQQVRGCIPLIAFGNGRSYGDSALAANHLPMQQLKRMLAFEEATGLLTCEAGVLLADIVESFLPRGWFPMITPGTKLITVGGAIASDVHGKNHHIVGCFSECLDHFLLMSADGSIKRCSRRENPELFHATCGGMGLTGVIMQASFYLKPVRSSTIEQTTIKTANLHETFAAFEEYQGQPYSVAWIDCLARGDKLGRALLMVGDFAEDGNLEYRPGGTLNVPVDFPTLTLNSFSVKAFNAVYYARAGSGVSHRRVGIDGFFYPLDAIRNWNRIYGKRGFVQYQFILPKTAGYEGLKQILQKISASGMGSFLAVLKLYGPANKNYLSFPLEGYSLALDFKMQPGLVELLAELDQLVVEYRGRVFLAKDATTGRESFEKGYPNVERFRALRRSLGLNQVFNSLQSQRLGL